MSLKAFHLFFIAISALFFFAFGVWLLATSSLEVWPVLGSLLCFVAGALLVVYGLRFLKKFKNVGMI